MVAFRNTIIAIAVISFFTFVALFGKLPALRRTPIGLLQRILCIHIPSGFRRVDGRYTGGRLNRAIAGLTNYLLHQKNPVVLIIFLVLLTGSAFIFLRATHTLLSPLQLSPLAILLTSPYLYTYLCLTTTTDHISHANHSSHLHAYPYDHILFRPATICRTCQITKPARSKHCSLCNTCVAKADHHCPWVNNCLGAHNYRYFLLLLLSLTALEYYGAYLAWRLLAPAFGHVDSRLAWTDRRYWDLWGQGFVRAVNAGGLSVAGVGLLAVTTAPLPLGLLGYHVYLVWAGMTTNESSKWADWGDDMADGFVFQAKRAVVLERERERRANKVGGASLLPSGDDEPVCKWPIRSHVMVVRTTDGKPPVGQEDLWEKVTDLDHVVNIYDLGFARNLLSIMRGK